MRLMSKSGEFWVGQASLAALHDAVSEIETWTDDEAAVLDEVYKVRTEQLIRRTRAESRDDAYALAAHLEHVAHDSARDQLDALERPYFTRWRLLTEMLYRVADRLEVPQVMLGRKHVMDILRRVARAGGRLPQGELDMIDNEGQRSVTLKLMEKWELIERVTGPGKTKIVTLTDLGRVAVGDTATAAGDTAEPSTTWKPSFTELMYQARA